MKTKNVIILMLCFFLFIQPIYAVVIVSGQGSNVTENIQIVNSLPSEILKSISRITFYNYEGNSATVPYYWDIINKLNPLFFPKHKNNNYCGFLMTDDYCYDNQIIVYDCDKDWVLWHELGHYYDLCILKNTYYDRIEEAELFADNFKTYWSDKNE